MKKKFLTVLAVVFVLIGLVTVSTSIFADSLEKLPEPTLRLPADPDNDPDNWFFNYRLTNLTEATDDLVGGTVGSALGIDGDSWWVYPSFNSASVGFATTKSSLTRIEYGEVGYNNKTSVSESYYFNHLHYLTGLKENTTYHYRVIYQDRTGLVKATADRTFTTKRFTGETKLTHKDFPLQIEKAGTYVLTEDVVSAGLGINVKASDVTIDLNGHTLIYDNAAPTATKSETSGWQYIEDANYGIRAGLWNFANIRIYNGTIKQGKAGTAEMSPIFLYHMSSATKNEVAGVTVDYYSDSTAGMRTNNGDTHHNVVYDRGTEIIDRHAGLRALHAGVSSKISYNSLRRFRHRGIDCDGAGCEVANNELYSDSYATNSFAIGSGEDHFIHDNKIFGVGYLFIGIGWGNGMHAADNLIYGRCYAPNVRSEEYARPSSVAGMRVTDFDGNGYSKGMLVENNTIVLLAEKSPVGEVGCTMARGLWLSNGVHDSANSLVYRHNTIKVEALSGNFDAGKSQIYYNGDVNNALAPISVQGMSWTSTDISRAVLFEDNYLMSNVNHIVVGEGYGITNGTQFYRTTLEKINHDSEFFHSVRIGFWYWNTLENKMIDTRLVNVSEQEFVPQFFGGAGKMDMTYGFTWKLRFIDQDGGILAKRTLEVRIDGDQILRVVTDGEGYAVMEVLESKYYKYGNSQENDGVVGVPGRIDYDNYQFALAGYTPKKLSVAALKSAEQVVVERTRGEDDGSGEVDDESNGGDNSSSDSDDGSDVGDISTPPEITKTGASSLFSALFITIVSVVGFMFAKFLIYLRKLQ
jgi:hypothetical protein